MFKREICLLIMHLFLLIYLINLKVKVYFLQVRHSHLGRNNDQSKKITKNQVSTPSIEKKQINYAPCTIVLKQI